MRNDCDEHYHHWLLLRWEAYIYGITIILTETSARISVIDAWTMIADMSIVTTCYGCGGRKIYIFSLPWHVEGLQVAPKVSKGLRTWKRGWKICQGVFSRKPRFQRPRSLHLRFRHYSKLISSRRQACLAPMSWRLQIDPNTSSRLKKHLERE